MADIDSRLNSFEEKTVTEVEFPVSYSSTHNIILNVHAPIFLHRLHANVRYAFRCSKHCHCYVKDEAQSVVILFAES
jgi:hypothetical protein